jgi:hypothetical protein
MGPFSRRKVRLGCDADQKPPFSAKVKKDLKLYILSSKHVHGTTLLSLTPEMEIPFKTPSAIQP